MDREKMKLTDEVIENDKLIQLSKESYITKEELIKILEELNCIAFKSITLNCITGFKVAYNENEKYVKTYGFDINIY